MPETTPRIDTRQTADGLSAVPLGEWTAARLTVGKAWRGATAALAARGQVAVWDLRELRALDHLGALTLWDHWGRQWPARVEADPAQRAVLERVASHPDDAPPRRPGGLAQHVDTLGSGVIQAALQVRDFTTLMGQLLLDFLRLLRAPHWGPWRDFSGHLYRIGAQALPITALVGFLIGVVLAYLMSQVLRQFGAETFIVNILGLALIRELGPLLAAVLIAGRSGSAITAQIGVMRVTEELDAMRVLGIAPGFRLVLPRALALAIAMPLISAWTTLASLIGGILAADITLGITPAYFYEALPKAVPLTNLALASAKSVVFGVSIALIGCHYGLRVKPNTESLGQGTTASVVASITAVILIDALFAVLFKKVGM
ncbi:ABC transporter permease [Ottowia sp.]|uniref:MlaE family ABC transporter permease n=1 Tax=Ottowia sp. TaxID=1898956 RepID=UPI002BD1AD2E|nr:ABC transporter permease [Ottowia sp.]HOB66935.1 ABC transporter permease [Ottowia sp.]HPZ58265.1 ABC transporter permease [Ottowia sp.]HQD47931.1 ABC transporter permease [Ottowia sp.]